jgi:hypothetical protein
MNGAQGKESGCHSDCYSYAHPCGSGVRLARRLSAAAGIIARAQGRSQFGESK